MKLQPLISLWILVPYTLAALVAIGWQMWRMRRQKRAILLLWSRRAALLLLPAIVAFGPSIAGGTSSPGVSNLDVIFMVDNTPSMGALDYDGTQQRIAGIQKDLLALGNKFQGARLEVITFDSNANIILPFTTDLSAFSSAVQGMTPEPSTYSQGTDISIPISLAVQQLQASKAAYSEHDRLVFYLSDGEQTAGTAVQSFAPLSSYISGGAVLGYGTTTGAQMVDYNALPAASGTVPSYIQTVNLSTGKLGPAISKMDPSNLQAIASQMKIKFLDRDRGGSINSVYAASKAQLNIDNSQHIVRYLNLYWLLTIPFAVLIFLEWQNIVTNLLALRNRPRGQHG